MLLYITVIILPNVDVSTKSAKEIAGISQARTAAEKIVNTTNEVALSGERARQTISVYVPMNSTVNCESEIGSPGKISFNYKLFDPNLGEDRLLPSVDGCINDEDKLADPDGNTCFKTFTMISGYNISCAGTFPLDGGEDGKLTTVTINKTLTELTITANP